MNIQEAIKQTNELIKLVVEKESANSPESRQSSLDKLLKHSIELEKIRYDIENKSTTYYKDIRNKHI